MVDDGRLQPEAFADVQTRVERARGIRATAPIDVRIVGGAELAEIVRRATLADWPHGTLEKYQESLVTVGLWPSDKNLLDQLAGTLGDEAVGLYVPEARALYVVDGAAVPLRVRLASMLAGRDLVVEYALAHELVHYLQHQAYPQIFDHIATLRHDDDAAWALQAAIEGDAVRYGFATFESMAAPPAPVDFATRVEEGIHSGALAKQPGLIRRGLVFPYAAGYRLSVLEASLLLDRPPASTEQALHPDKRWEPFLTIDVTAFRSSLPSACEAVYDNSLGELGLSILLHDHLADPDPVAWWGWDGDRYLVARCAGQREFVWLTAWDTEHDAEEFAGAYREIAASVRERGGLAAMPIVTVFGRDSLIATPALAAFGARLRSDAERRRISGVDELPHR